MLLALSGQIQAIQQICRCEDTSLVRSLQAAILLLPVLYTRRCHIFIGHSLRNRCAHMTVRVLWGENYLAHVRDVECGQGSIHKPSLLHIFNVSHLCSSAVSIGDDVPTWQCANALH